MFNSSIVMAGSAEVFSDNVWNIVALAIGVIGVSLFGYGLLVEEWGVFVKDGKFGRKG